MASLTCFHRRRQRCQGVALLIVLAIITLVVILLLAFLVMMTLDWKTTASYGQSIKVQEMGLAALQEITCDLKQEIVAGSKPAGTPTAAVYTTTDPVTGKSVASYVPATNKSAVPARIGFSTSDYLLDVDSASPPVKLPPTLIRVSRDSTDAFYTSPSTTDYPGTLPPARATLASSATSSSNGRSIAGSRWNKPLLLHATTTPSRFTAAPPEWVYVGRNGSLNTSASPTRAFTDADAVSGTLFADPAGTNANAILGRYAYVIYDEGALLDANVAGADATTVASAAFRGKSALSYADLTQIPGLTQTLLTGLVNWRNQGGLVAWGSYPSLVLGAAGQSGFLTAFGPANTGATSAYPTTVQATHNDNPLVSRQDLIDYCTKVVGSTSPLPYLGTFTRAVNAPSYCPVNILSPAATYPYAQYGNGAETAGQANRNLANVRLPSTGTSAFSLIHYKDDGTTKNLAANPGAPLLQRRFSLARLKWLGSSGPNSAAFASSLSTADQSAAILACFGLTWNAQTWNTGFTTPFSNACPGWTYNHGYVAGSPHIFTLDEVAAAKREPDFFELLKAAILNGSLGRDPGAMPANLLTVSGPFGKSFDLYSNIPDSQIIQIGANIIDQADGDSYPTAIYFAKHALVNSWDWLYDTAFGDEDLPSLYRFYQVGFTYDLTDAATRNGTMAMWFQPQLWNPHQQPATAPTPAPTQFRISTHGQAYTLWKSGTVQLHSPTIDYDLNPAQGQVYFNTTSLAFRDQPLVLSTDIGASSLYSLNQWSSSMNTDVWYPPTNKFVGICSGSVAFTMDSTAPNVGRKLNTNTPLTFVLEYSPDNGTTYYPYNLFSRLYGTPSSVNSFRTATPSLNFPDNSTLPTIYYVRSDPRTDRFSASEFYLDSISSANNPSGRLGMGDWLNATQQPNATSTASIATQYFQPSSTSGFTYATSSSGFFYINSFAENITTGKSYYADPDGVVRPGDGFRRNTTTGDGCFLYHTASATYPNSPLPTAVPSIVGIDNAQAGRRPVILNRAFRSVGELGYAFRDQPYKSLDFWSQSSGDAALLDVFSIQDEPTLVAGQFNPNNAPVPVLKAILSGGAIKEIDSTVTYSSTDLGNVATAIATYLSSNPTLNTTPKGPLLNRADLVTAGYPSASGADLSSLISGAFSSSTSFGKAAKANKSYGEAPVRALSAVTNIRTWNLMIDVIAQSGHMIPKAQTLNDFVVEGEKRYWLHLAIDRYTGEVVDEQLEPAYE